MHTLDLEASPKPSLSRMLPEEMAERERYGNGVWGTVSLALYSSYGKAAAGSVGFDLCLRQAACSLPWLFSPCSSEDS